MVAETLFALLAEFTLFLSLWFEAVNTPDYVVPNAKGKKNLKMSLLESV
jgi:hypothetical protein